MVDLFALRDFVGYLSNEFPTIKISAIYDLSDFILYIQISPKAYYKDIEYYSGQFTATDTKQCIEYINGAFLDYAAYLAHNRIKL